MSSSRGHVLGASLPAEISCELQPARRKERFLKGELILHYVTATCNSTQHQWQPHSW